MGEKAIDWRGSSYNDLLAFPDDAKRIAGFELGRVQLVKTLVISKE